MIRAQYSWPRVELSLYKRGLDGRESQTAWPGLHAIKLLQHKIESDKKYSGLILLGRNCSLTVEAGGEREPCLLIHICPEKRSISMNSCSRGEQVVAQIPQIVAIPTEI